MPNTLMPQAVCRPDSRQHRHYLTVLNLQMAEVLFVVVVVIVNGEL